MDFFSPEKLKRKRIEIDSSQVNAKSEAVQKRLNRIQENYRQLDEVLAELESKIALDDRLSALDDAGVDFEATFGIKKKRKWKSPTTERKSLRRAPANPKKPR
ncbi:MAG: putative nuclease with TOPRIM domain [Mariniblastus sp.]|jgi:predicted nuclease with TOPRIM domain